MLRLPIKVLLALCGAAFLGTPAFAQGSEEQGGAAGPSAPVQSDSAGPLPTEAAAPNLGHSTQAQAEHSAQATAHKSVNDPNNQMGTSLQGRTRPVGGDDGSSQNGVSSNPAAGAQ
jgi:hypothetical protein